MFRARFAVDYNRFNQRLSEEGLIERQALVGTYYTDQPDRGDEADSVPA